MKHYQYFRFTSIITAFLLLSGCLSPQNLNIPFETIEPQDIGDGWAISTPEAENMVGTALKEVYQQVYEDDDYWTLHSLLTIRNEKLVSEAYFKNKTDIQNQRLIWSCTKQVMGILAGIALEKGIIKDLNDPISDYLTEELVGHDDKKDITIGNLLTMQSGIDYENNGPLGETYVLMRQIPDDMVEFILDRPMNAMPGTGFHYNDGDPHLLSAIIQKQVGKPTDEWADEVLFSKIGVTNYTWQRYKDGISLGGYGIETSPRELAKIALLVLNKGNHNGEQIVSENWITEMTSSQIATIGFGYFWWVEIYGSSMSGHGGQHAFIIPEKDLIVITTAKTNTQGKAGNNYYRIISLVRKIMEATE